MDVNERAFPVGLRALDRCRGLRRDFIPDHFDVGLPQQIADCAELASDELDWRKISVVMNYLEEHHLSAFVGVSADFLPSAPDVFEACNILVHEKQLRGVEDAGLAFEQIEPMIEACLENGYSTTGRILLILYPQDEESMDIDICVEVVEGSLNDGLFARLKSWITG